MSLRAENYLRSGARGELAMSAHKVRVQVSLYHIPYLQAFAGGLHDVTVNVALRVNDSRFAFRAYEIRSMCEASEVELFEVHGRPPLKCKMQNEKCRMQNCGERPLLTFSFLILHFAFFCSLYHF